MKETGAIIDRAAREGRNCLLEYEAERVFADYGIGFPVVLKVMSPQIIHKSDAGAVKAGIADQESLVRAREEIVTSARRYAPAADIKGILVQKMISGKREVIVGASRDPQFGPVIMFGLGGIFVEVFQDVVFRVAPVSEAEALRMIREIRAFPVLEGVRGEKPIDFPALAEVISKISRLVLDFPRITELDANPVLVSESGAVVLDARIIL
jgi:acyl-CoA synthetase (NDP forming)